MITENMVYWATRLDYFHNISLVFAIASGVVLFIAAMLTLSCFADHCERPFDETRQESVYKNIKIFILLFLISVALFSVWAFVPTTKEYAAIKIIPAIANSEFVQNDLPNEAKELYVLAKEYIKKETGK